MKKTTKNYIFIHGAWHGSWCFNKYITPVMNNLNYKTYSIDLPGHFNNSNYNFKDVTLDSYVKYVYNFINNNIKGKVILVGHSMGGLVISQVAENLPSKISHLAYISAFIPTKNGSLIEEEKKSNHQTVSLKVKIDENLCSISLDQNLLKELFYQNCREEDIIYAKKFIQHQPLLPFIEKVELGNNFDNIPKTYIECLKDNAIHIEDQRRMNQFCDKVISIDTDHSPFFSRPEELIKILGDIKI